VAETDTVTDPSQAIMKNILHCFKIVAGFMGKRKAFTGPLWVQIGISNPCNHRCIMCWDHPSVVAENSPYPTEEHERYYKSYPEIDRDKGFMDLEMLRELIADLRNLGTRRIELVGRGEPTLHPKFDQVIEILKNYEFTVGMATNGSLLTPKRCEHLVRCGLDRIIVSLNAGTRNIYPSIHTTEKPESFDKIVENIKILDKIKHQMGKNIPLMALSFVISRINWNEGLKMIDRAGEAGANRIIFKYVTSYPNIEYLELTDEEKRDFSKQTTAFIRRAKRYGMDIKLEPPIGDETADIKLSHQKNKTIYSRIPCYIGWYFTLVTAEGSVIPCCQCMIKMGDLKHQRFTDIWYSDRYDDFREKMKRFPEHYNALRNCACDQCEFEKINTTIYNKLHFYSPLHLHNAQSELSFFQLLRMIMQGQEARGSKTFRRRLTSSRG